MRKTIVFVLIGILLAIPFVSAKITQAETDELVSELLPDKEAYADLIIGNKIDNMYKLLGMTRRDIHVGFVFRAIHHSDGWKAFSEYRNGWRPYKKLGIKYLIKGNQVRQITTL